MIHGTCRIEDEEGQRYRLFRKGLYDTAGYAGIPPDHQIDAVGRADRMDQEDQPLIAGFG